MKKINTFLLMLLCVFVFTSCGSSTNKEKQWGSFTAEKTNSFDDVFYAVQTVEEKDDASYIVVDVYKTENDEKNYNKIPDKTATLKIIQAQGSITITNKDSFSKVYDGNPVVEPTFARTGTGNVIIEYYEIEEVNGTKEENLRLVINRFDKKAVKKGKLLNIDEIIDKTYIRLLGFVPEEKNLMYASVTEKRISQYSDAKIAFSNIAGRILGKEIELYL